MKPIVDVLPAPPQHWVGDGFPVRSLFSYHRHAQQLSPFLLLDRAGPAEFAPATQPRGVGQHPHRGFETVTIVYSGEVAHRDSVGNGGVIGPGDVQWMTAAAGILHQEFHSEAFTRNGGTLDMVQLWVNLPARDKLALPRYQAIVAATIPRLSLAGGAATLRLIAGEFDGQRGPAQTFSPLLVADVQLTSGASVELPTTDGWTTALVVLRGGVRINGTHAAQTLQTVLLGRAGSGLRVEAMEDTLLLLLSGEPLHEPVVGYGPFVMNTQQEIVTAIDAFNRGEFGRMDN